MCMDLALMCESVRFLYWVFDLVIGTKLLFAECGLMVLTDLNMVTIVWILLNSFQPALDLLFLLSMGCLLRPNAITLDITSLLSL